MLPSVNSAVRVVNAKYHGSRSPSHTIIIITCCLQRSAEYLSIRDEYNTFGVKSRGDKNGVFIDMRMTVIVKSTHGDKKR